VFLKCNEDDIINNLLLRFQKAPSLSVGGNEKGELKLQRLPIVKVMFQDTGVTGEQKLKRRVIQITLADGIHRFLGANSEMVKIHFYLKFFREMSLYCWTQCMNGHYRDLIWGVFNNAFESLIQWSKF
jgi:hypothetical protein